MKFRVIATNYKTGEVLPLGDFPTEAEAQYNIDHNIEWDEDDIPEDWDFDIEPVDDEYEEPADIDDDCGFDPYMGCYSYDCQGVATMKDLIKVIVWFLVINFSICNQIWTEPVSYWWIIEIIVLIISILMVDKSQFWCYNKCINKKARK